MVVDVSSVIIIRVNCLLYLNPQPVFLGASGFRGHSEREGSGGRVWEGREYE